MGAAYTPRRRCSRDRLDASGRRLPLLNGQPCTPVPLPPTEAHSDEASSAIHSRSPVRPSPRLWSPDGTGTLGLSLELRTPPSPATHVKVGTGHEHTPGTTSSTHRRSLHNQPTHHMRPHVAPSAKCLSCSVTWTLSKPSFPYKTGTFAYQHPYRPPSHERRGLIELLRQADP